MGQSKSSPVKVNIGQEDEMEIEGFQRDWRRVFLTCLAVLFTGGLLLILLTWKKNIKLNCTYKRCPLNEADKILVTDAYEQMFEENVLRETDNSKHTYSSIYFFNKQIKYVWNEEILQFSKLSNIDYDVPFTFFHTSSQGLDTVIVSQRQVLYGENFIKINVIPVIRLLLDVAVNPFYIFQVYTVIIWSLQGYYNFAIVIAVLSVISISISVWETRRQSRALRDTMKSQSDVTLLRNGSEMTVSSKELVPGDVLLLPSCGQFIMECDAVLIHGTCVVNESMLTGESVPVTKVSIPQEDAQTYDYITHKQYTLFCGTEVLQGKVPEGSKLWAVVIRTGFMTMKGELVRAILFPPPLDFRFYSDFLRALFVFLFLGLCGMSYSFYVWSINGGTLEEVIYNSLDILTFVVPPILPAAITAINVFAQRRLKKEEIYCLHSTYINLCGGIDVVCFDKTGTLTDSDLDLSGVIPIADSQFQEVFSDPTNLQKDSPLVLAMATCHSLTKINNKLVGYPMEIKLFQSIDWLLDEHPDSFNPDYQLSVGTVVQPKCMSLVTRDTKANDLEIALLKQFPFESSQQRMTVITRRKYSSGFDVYFKGAPEKIASLCDPSTVPQEFPKVLNTYAKQGYRVIASAWKALEDGAIWEEVKERKREEIEANARFLGLIIMQNLVKPETYVALQELHDADIKTVMVTGDNIQTAISVSRDCEMVMPDQNIILVEAEFVPPSLHAVQHVKVSYTDPESEITTYLDEKSNLKAVHSENYVFAIDGSAFEMIRNHNERLLDKIITRGKVFARMLPDQKIQLIEALQRIGHQVSMCGDGCNDCGALKRAHAGLSLSTAEASVAAPFTSKRANIQSVPTLLKEGRATLVSGFATFKFGVVYCFTQFISVLMVFWISTEPSDEQYLLEDMFIAAIPMTLMGNFAPHSILVKQKPSCHLLSFLPLFSVISFLFFQIVIYVGLWHYIGQQSWFEPYEFVPGVFPVNPSYRQTFIFIAEVYSDIIAVVIYSKAAPYRKNLFSNKIMVAWLVFAVSTMLFITLYRGAWLVTLLNFKIAPYIEFHVIIVLISFANFLFSYVWEVLFLEAVIFHRLLPYLKKLRGPQLPFEHLEEELKMKTGWPPLGKTSEVETEYGESGVETDIGLVPRESRKYPLPLLNTDEEDMVTLRAQSNIYVTPPSGTIRNSQLSQMEEQRQSLEESDNEKQMKGRRHRLSVKDQILRGLSGKKLSFRSFGSYKKKPTVMKRGPKRDNIIYDEVPYASPIIGQKLAGSSVSPVPWSETVHYAVSPVGQSVNEYMIPVINENRARFYPPAVTKSSEYDDGNEGASDFEPETPMLQFMCRDDSILLHEARTPGLNKVSSGNQDADGAFADPPSPFKDGDGNLQNITGSQFKKNTCKTQDKYVDDQNLPSPPLLSEYSDPLSPYNLPEAPPELNNTDNKLIDFTAAEKLSKSLMKTADPSDFTKEAITMTSYRPLSASTAASPSSETHLGDARYNKRRL